jgi:mannose-6-phosphate isomerase-like protein (cupin superfamily)
MNIRLFSCLVLLITPLLAQTQESDPFDFYSAAELDEFAAAIAADPRGGPGRVIDQENYWGVISHRTPASGSAESHRDWTDIYFVSDGTAELVVGGTINDAKETAPGEIRGSTIKGGTRRALAEGDVVHIPPGTAHHVIVAEGETLTYLLLKVKVE